MTRATLTSIQTIELVAWGLDDYEARPRMFDRERLLQSHAVVVRRPWDECSNALCKERSCTLGEVLGEVLEVQQSRPDLQAEMLGLDWFLGVIDLRRLLTFQRRLSFHAALPATAIPRQSDWRGLMEIAFAPPHPIACDLIRQVDGNTITLRSNNPNLHLRVTEDPSTPIAVHAGSPFFEVAQYAGRWLLRDGYHRAYNLLRAGIFYMPALIVRARTLEELGANQPHFFSEATILSPHPPLVGDFLDDRLTIHYDRPPAVKTLRITMDESIAYPHLATISGEQR
jgi:hypothetical protein